MLFEKSGDCKYLRKIVGKRVLEQKRKKIDCPIAAFDETPEFFSTLKLRRNNNNKKSDKFIGQRL